MKRGVLGPMAALDDCYNIPDLRLAAQRRLPKGVFEFVVIRLQLFR